MMATACAASSGGKTGARPARRGLVPGPAWAFRPSAGGVVLESVAQRGDGAGHETAGGQARKDAGGCWRAERRGRGQGPLVRLSGRGVQSSGRPALFLRSPEIQPGRLFLWGFGPPAVGGPRRRRERRGMPHASPGRNPRRTRPPDPQRQGLTGQSFSPRLGFWRRRPAPGWRHLGRRRPPHGGRPEPVEVTGAPTR